MAEYLSTLGIAHIQKSIDRVFEEANSVLESPIYKTPNLTGIIFNRVRYIDKGTMAEEDYMDRMRKFYPNLTFNSYISQSTKIAERPAQSEPIALSPYAADQQYANQVHMIAEEFYDRITRPETSW